MIGQQADLKAAREYFRSSLSYTKAERKRSLRFLKRAARKAGTYTDAQFLVLVARLAARADNGHDYFDSGSGWWPSTRLPFRLEAFPDALAVSRAAPGHTMWLGSRVVSLEGLPVAEVQHRLKPYFGGTAAYARWCGTWALEFGGLLHAMGLARQPDRLTLGLVPPGAKTVTRLTVEFVPNGSCPGYLRRAQSWSCTPHPSEVALGWQAAAKGPDPLYLQDPGRLFRVEQLPGLQTLYVQFRTHYGSPDEPMEPFLLRLREEAGALSPRNLILDLRFDSGGNSDLTVDTLRFFADTIPGRVYVLVGQYTFSAGIVTAALAKRLAGGRTVLVGEPVGDRLRWWSEGRQVPLPSSGYSLHACDGLWDLERGCEGETGCYGDRFDAAVGSLEPDVQAPLTWAAWLTGRDPGLEAVVRHLGLSSAGGFPPVSEDQVRRHHGQALVDEVDGYPGPERRFQETLSAEE